jgi:hypothetical protein
MSPGWMSSPNFSRTAFMDHATGTMCSGWSCPLDIATIWAWPSMRTQEKSSPSYRMDEYAVRTSVTRISRTTDTKASRSTSRVMGSITGRPPGGT